MGRISRNFWVGLPAVVIALLGGCSTRPVDQRTDTAEVYSAFLEDPWYPGTGPQLLVDLTDTVASDILRNAAGAEQAPDTYSSDVREALEDLFERSKCPQPLVWTDAQRLGYQRITPDSVRKITARYEAMKDAQRAAPLPDRAVVLSLSPVGFSRDGSVAVVVGTQLCGWLCGETQVRVLRKHHEQWFPAEVLAQYVN